MRTNRRAFTLLETILAAALGGMVVVGVVGVIGALDRAESVQTARADQTAEFERAQIVMRRAMGSLAMAGGSAGNNNPNARAGGAQGQTGDQAGNQGADRFGGQGGNRSQAGAGRTSVRPGAQPTGDGGRSLGGLSQQGGTGAGTGGTGGAGSGVGGSGGSGGGGGGGGIPGLNSITPSVRFSLTSPGAQGAQTSTTPSGQPAASRATSDAAYQRLELSLASLPLPERVYLGPASVTANETLQPFSVDPEADEFELDTLTDEELAAESASEGGPEASETVPLFRGVFELSPPRVDPTRANSNRNAGASWEEAQGLTLWWRQLPLPVADPLNPGAMIAAPMTDPRDDPEAVPLLTGLTSATWRVFKSRELLTGLDATYSDELPAYVQFEFRTHSGLYGNWMFEVGWTTVRDPAQQALLAAAAEARSEAAANARARRGRGEGGEGRDGSMRGRGGPPGGRDPQVWRDGQQGRPANSQPIRREGMGGPQ